MKGFIKLTLRHGSADVCINPERIESIRDIRTDKLAEQTGGWDWTIVTCTKERYEVKESEQEIMNLIMELQ